MSIFGKCEDCGGQTIDYFCPGCEGRGTAAAKARIKELETENAELQEIVNRVSDGKEVNCHHASDQDPPEICDCWSCKADELWRRWWNRQPREGK